MVNYQREGNLNVFTFQVNDADVAMAALLDAPKLFTIGNVTEKMRPSPLVKGAQFFELFVLSGFPRTETPGAFTPILVQGRHGEVGATYSYSFLTGMNVKQEVNVHTELVEVVDEEDVKRVVYRHRNEATGNIKVGGCCVDSPKLPMKNTESRFELARQSTSWSVRFSFTGPNALDPRTREGTCNYWSMNFTVALILLPCCPMYLCYMYATHFSASEELLQQIGRVHKYCNGTTTTNEAPAPVYAEATIVPRTGPLDAKRSEKGGQPIQEEIPMAQVSEEDTREKALKRWFELYKSGAISKSEYDIEKARILRDI